MPDAASDACPTRADLTAYVAGSLPAEERAVTAEHVPGCDSCAHRLALVERLQSLGDPESGPVPIATDAGRLALDTYLLAGAGAWDGDRDRRGTGATAGRYGSGAAGFPSGARRSPAAGGPASSRLPAGPGPSSPPRRHDSGRAGARAALAGGGGRPWARSRPVAATSETQPGTVASAALAASAPRWATRPSPPTARSRSRTAGDRRGTGVRRRRRGAPLPTAGDRRSLGAQFPNGVGLRRQVRWTPPTPPMEHRPALCPHRRTARAGAGWAGSGAAVGGRLRALAPHRARPVRGRPRPSRPRGKRACGRTLPGRTLPDRTAGQSRLRVPPQEATEAAAAPGGGEQAWPIADWAPNELAWASLAGGDDGRMRSATPRRPKTRHCRPVRPNRRAGSAGARAVALEQGGGRGGAGTRRRRPDRRRRRAHSGPGFLRRRPLSASLHPKVLR